MILKSYQILLVYPSCAYDHHFLSSAPLGAPSPQGEG